MTFHESELICNAALKSMNAARDKFLAAYEAYKSAGLLVDDGHVYSADEVEISERYEDAMAEFSLEVQEYHKAEGQWFDCMNGDGTSIANQWN